MHVELRRFEQRHFVGKWVLSLPTLPLTPRSHDTGMEFCQQNSIPVSTIHTILGEYYSVYMLRSHNIGAKSDSSLVRFSYFKFEALLLTIFIACHEDVRFPATTLLFLNASFHFPCTQRFCNKLKFIDNILHKPDKIERM